MRNLISKKLSIFSLGLVVGLVAVIPSSAAVTGTKTLSHHVPAAVSNLSSKGQLGSTNILNLALGLPVRDAEALTNLLQQIYDPASTNYHHYLSPAEFTARFGPTKQDYQAAIDFAQANGLEVTAQHPNRLVLDVRGNVSAINRAFNVTIKTYRHPLESRDFFATDVDPTVNSALPFLHISGLDNYSIPHPKIKLLPASQPSGGNPSVGSGPGQSYIGNDFRKAYVPGSPLTGAGQNIGLLQFDGFYPSDIAAYATLIGLTSNVPNLVVVPVDGGVPVPTAFGNGEVSLDIETVLAMSPGVSNIYVYEAPNPSPWVDILSKMANDNLAKQLSCSWGGGGPNPVAEQIFQQMALQGQTFFNASGDSDAFVGAISFPSDSPHITEVGGTTLTTGAGASYATETVWNWGNEFGTNYDGVGSSGGISTYYAIPSWQTNVNFTTSHGSTTMRNVPDVALTADNVWVIFGGGQTGAFGGTSCAAPLWAGFTALINQQASLNGHAPVGFINPALYAIASGTNYTNCFHDITTGNNEWSGSTNLFSAVLGFDLCTGLGTPNGTNLINTLTAGGVTNPITHISPPPAPYGTTLSALKGSNPNGDWLLFIQDDTPLDSGSISNGWVLTLTSANPVGEIGNLQLLMTASATDLTLGNNLTYVIGVTNSGPSTCTNIVVLDTLPPGVTVVSTAVTQGAVSDLNWNVGTLTNGAGAQLTLIVKPSIIGDYLNFAVASSDTMDANPDDNVASVSVNVGPVAPPKITAGFANFNGSFQFSITSKSWQTNVIQASTNLVSWVPIYTNIGSFLFIDPQATNYRSRFYRDLLINP